MAGMRSDPWTDDGQLHAATGTQTALALIGCGRAIMAGSGGVVSS
jgi:hypothetical protein